jgi:hypothetical protein
VGSEAKIGVETARSLRLAVPRRTALFQHPASFQELTPRSESHVLQEGNAFYFRVGVSHSVENPSHERCSCLAVLDYVDLVDDLTIGVCCRSVNLSP